MASALWRVSDLANSETRIRQHTCSRQPEAEAKYYAARHLDRDLVN